MENNNKHKKNNDNNDNNDDNNKNTKKDRDKQRQTETGRDEQRHTETNKQINHTMFDRFNKLLGSKMDRQGSPREPQDPPKQQRRFVSPFGGLLGLSRATRATPHLQKWWFYDGKTINIKNHFFTRPKYSEKQKKTILSFWLYLQCFWMIFFELLEK